MFLDFHTVTETESSGNIMFSISKQREHCEMLCLPCSSVLGLSRLQQIYIVVKNKKIYVGRKTTCESVRKKEEMLGQRGQDEQG